MQARRRQAACCWPHWGERRPSRDIYLQTSTTGGDTGAVLAAVRQIVGIPVLDGWEITVRGYPLALVTRVAVVPGWLSRL